MYPSCKILCAATRPSSLHNLADLEGIGLPRAHMSMRGVGGGAFVFVVQGCVLFLQEFGASMPSSMYVEVRQRR